MDKLFLCRAIIECMNNENHVDTKVLLSILLMLLHHSILSRFATSYSIFCQRWTLAIFNIALCLIPWRHYPFSTKAEVIINMTCYQCLYQHRSGISCSLACF